jgi:hypothetical protein
MLFFGGTITEARIVVELGIDRSYRILNKKFRCRDWIVWATVEMKLESNTMNWWDECSLSSLWEHLIYCL